MKMKKITALCLAASTLLAASTAMAWESEDGTHAVDFGVAIATDYIWRGYSQTNEDPAVSGSIDYSHSSGLYVGTWASNVDFGDDAESEIDIYAGFAGEFGESGVGYDVGVLRYIYDHEDYDWNELYASLSYSYFSVGVAHSDDVYGSDEDGTYFSASFDYDLPFYGLALSMGVGYYDYDSGAIATNSEEHTDYRIGLSKNVGGFDLGVTYSDMDNDGEDVWGNLAKQQVVFSVSKSL